MKRTAFALLGFLLGISTWAQNSVWTEKFKIGGFLQAGYQVDKNSNSFYLKRARVALTGVLFEKEERSVLDYKFQTEFAGSPKIVDLYLRVSPVDAFGVQIGQFKIPLTIENPDFSPTKLEFIDYSLIVQRLARMSKNDMSGISSSGRDIGIKCYGRFLKAPDGHYFVSYELGVFNGAGINTTDFSHAKEFVGRLDVRPVADLLLTGYYMTGLGKNTVRMDRYGGGFSYQGRRFFARAEYLGGHTDTVISGGFYAMAGYNFNPHWNVCGRYDLFVPDRSKPEKQHYITVGASYSPIRHFKIQLNYMHKTEADKSTSDLASLMLTILY